LRQGKQDRFRDYSVIPSCQPTNRLRDSRLDDGGKLLAISREVRGQSLSLLGALVLRGEQRCQHLLRGFVTLPGLCELVLQPGYFQNKIGQIGLDFRGIKLSAGFLEKGTRAATNLLQLLGKASVAYLGLGQRISAYIQNLGGMLLGISSALELRRIPGRQI